MEALFLESKGATDLLVALPLLCLEWYIKFTLAAEAEDFTGCCYIFPLHLHRADKGPDLEEEEEKEEEDTIRP